MVEKIKSKESAKLPKCRECTQFCGALWRTR